MDPGNWSSFIFQVTTPSPRPTSHTPSRPPSLPSQPPTPRTRCARSCPPPSLTPSPRRRLGESARGSARARAAGAETAPSLPPPRPARLQQGPPPLGPPPSDPDPQPRGASRPHPGGVAAALRQAPSFFPPAGLRGRRRGPRAMRSARPSPAGRGRLPEPGPRAARAPGPR